MDKDVAGELSRCVSSTRDAVDVHDRTSFATLFGEFQFIDNLRELFLVRFKASLDLFYVFIRRKILRTDATIG